MVSSAGLARSGGAPSYNPLVAKLDLVTCLGDADRQAIRDVCGNRRRVPAYADIIGEGDRPERVHLILDGWAARYKMLPDGRRQIMAYLIPGDFCDLHVTILAEMDHGIVALTPVTVAYIPQAEIEELPLRRPALARGLWWATLVDEAVLRAWIVNLGRRDAYERVAHLMCEMHLRMKNIGLVEDGQFSLPLTQEEIADTLGMTSVHTNRVIQRLRREGLITLRERMLTIPDVPRLRIASGFDPAYLHSRLQAENGSVS